MRFWGKYPYFGRRNPTATLTRCSRGLSPCCVVHQVEEIEESCRQSEKVSELQHQNEELRRVIRHMRRDIEALGNQEPASAAPSDQVPAAVNSLSAATTNNGV